MPIGFVIGQLRDVATIVDRLVHHKGFHFAASASYRSLTAFFPLLLAVLSSLAVFGQAGEVSDAMGALAATEAAPSEAVEAIRRQLDQLADGSSGAHVQYAVLGIALAVWSGSAGMRAVIHGLNNALELDEHRPLSKVVAVSVLLAIVSAATIILATAMVAGGPTISGLLGDLPGRASLVHDAWLLLRWPALALLMFSWLAFVWSVAPATPQEFRIVTRGNVTASISWLAFTLLFSWYVDNLGEQGRVYGAFSGAIVLMLHAYWSALIIFLGAEVDGLHRLRRGEATTGDD